MPVPAPALLWVLTVTSAANRGWPGDLVISDHEAARLPSTSIVRVAKIVTIEPENAEPIGRLTVPDRAPVGETLRNDLVLVPDGSA